MDNKKLNIKLISKERSIEIKDEYKLLGIEGIESADYEINVVSNSQYDGGILNNKRIASRTINISAEYTGKGDFVLQRERLINFFNPINSGSLIINFGEIYDENAKQIDYEVENFKINQGNIYDKLSFSATLICPDPYFKDVNETKKVIAVWNGGLNFKFKLPTSFKIKSIEKDGGFQCPIDIKGQVESPLEIEFEGPAEKPCITNVTTGEFIRINRSLTKDETLYINTAYGNKVVKIRDGNGERNAFNYIDLSSVFFSLAPGKNIVKYSSANDKITEQNISIKFKNRYLGL